MSNSFEENLELSSRKYHSKGSAKRSSNPGIIGRSRFTKLKSRNDHHLLLEEFEPLLPVGRGGFAPDGAVVSEDEISSKIRQRTAKFSAAVEVEKPSINGIGPLADLANGERNTDSFLQNDFLLLDIKEGDTLQSISIQYHCSVSDLKRANNLISNQEFYALRQLRIPVKKHGLLTERLPLAAKKESDGFSSAENGYSVRTVSVGIGPMSPGGSQEDAVAFFRKMDEDLVKIMKNTKSQKDSLEAATIALTSLSIQPLVRETSHSGADCGIQWRYLVLVVILLGLILPIITVIYMYTQHHSENNSELQHNIDSHAQAFISLKKVNAVNKR